MKNTEVMKPITMAVAEFEQEVINAINNSQLPYFAIQTVLEKLTKTVEAAAVQQLNADTERYKAELEKVKTDESN